MIETLCWILPRPRTNPSYRGGFPLWFEIKLLRLYGEPEMILHPFGGMAEYGIANDINIGVYPDVVADAHNLPYPDETFDMVIFDPPYSAEEASKMYGTPYIKMKRCLAESIRVLKKEKYIAVYHRVWIPRPTGTMYDKRIIVCPGQNHEARICHVFRKTDKFS